MGTSRRNTSALCSHARTHTSGESKSTGSPNSLRAAAPVSIGSRPNMRK